MVKKNMLAYLRNCSYRNFGRNVKIVYFPVDIELFLNFCGCGLFINIFLVSGGLACPGEEELNIVMIQLVCYWTLISPETCENIH